MQQSTIPPRNMQEGRTANSLYSPSSLPNMLMLCKGMPQRDHGYESHAEFGHHHGPEDASNPVPVTGTVIITHDGLGSGRNPNHD